MIILEAPIQAVTVYTDRAKICRHGSTRLTPGEHTVILNELPMSVTNDSVRVTSTNEAIKIVDVEVKVYTIPSIEPAGAPELQAEYDGLQDQDEALRDDDRVEADRLNFLQNIRQSASQGMGQAIAQGGIPLENINELMEYIVQQQRQSQDRRRQIAADRRQIAKTMHELEAKAPPGVELKRRPTSDTPRLFSRPRPTDQSDSSDEESGRGAFGRSRNGDSNNDDSQGRRFGSRSPFGRPSAPPAEDPPPRSPFGERRPPTNRRKSIEITVVTDEKTDFDFDVHYSVNDATWEPFYDIRVAENEVTVTFMAQIRQRSGEDWPTVPLTLSTSRPMVNANIPKIRPWVIDVDEPPPPSRSGRSAFGRRSSDDGDNNRGRSPFGRRPSPPPPPTRPPFLRRSTPDPTPRPSQRTVNLELEPSEISGTTPTVSFEVVQPVAVPTDYSIRKADIMTLEFECELDFIAVPSQAELAYLCAKVRNQTDFTLLPGTAVIFFDSKYIGKTELKTVAPKDNFIVQVGEQDQIRVQRQLTEHMASRPHADGLHRTEFIYRMTVHNDAPVPVSLTVYDHLPITRNKDIKVLIRAITPQPVEQTDLNIFKWRVELEPGQRQEIVLGFALEHPRDMKIVSKG